MLAVAILRPTNTRRSTMPLSIIRLSQVSSPVSAGFTTTVPVNSLPVQRFPLPLSSAGPTAARTSRTSTCKLANAAPRIGSPRSAYSAASRLWISATTAAPSPTAAATRFVGLHSLGECIVPSMIPARTVSITTGVGAGIIISFYIARLVSEHMCRSRPEAWIWV